MVAFGNYVSLICQNSVWFLLCEVGVGEEVPFVSFIEEGDPPAVLDSMLQFPWSPVVVAPPGEVVAMGISVGEEEGPGVWGNKNQGQLGCKM